MIDKLELTQQEIIEIVQKSLSNLTFYNGIESDIYRLIGLVQDNQDFFGNPHAGQSCIKLAANKLEELLRVYRGDTVDKMWPK